jgi:predicted nucleic acid-binding protein
VTPVEAVHVVQADADDDAILECAAAARSDFLVTGDKHLLKLGSFRGTRIIKPASFLALRRGREGVTRRRDLWEVPNLSKFGPVYPL